jgi:Acetyltransferase (GNAT) domain
MTANAEYHSNFVEARRDAGAALGRPDGLGGGQHHLFDRIDWFEALHATWLADTAPLIARASAEGRSLWLFLVGRGTSVAAMSHWYSFAWRPIWSSAQPNADLALHVARSLKSKAATLELAPLPQEDGSAAMMADALRSAGWLVDVVEAGANHWLDTQGRSFDEWWAERPGALRSTVQRKGKKGLVALEILTHFDDAVWAEYEAVYAASWKPEEELPDFLRDWARREGEAGTLRLGIARIDGVAVAAQYWSVDDGVAYIHKLAHVSGHDALSPGTLLTHALFRHAFDVDRVRRIDFGTGDDGYKRDWMEASAPMMKVQAWNPAHPAAWPGIAKLLAKRVAAQLRSR